MSRQILLLVLFLLVWVGSAPSALATVFFGSATSASVVPGGAITYVGTGGDTSRDNCGTLTPTIPGGVVGDLLIAEIISREEVSTIATSAGWTQLYNDTYTGQDFRVFLYYRVATGSDTLTVTGSGTCSSLATEVARFRGVDSIQPFLNVPIPAGNVVRQDSNNIDTGTETTIAANAMLLVASFVENDRAITEGVGWTPSFENALNVSRDLAFNLHYQIQTTAGAKSISNWALGGTNRNYGIIFSLTPASTSSYTLNIPTPAGVAVGDLLLATVAATLSTVAVTPPAGWTLVRQVVQGSATSSTLSTYYRVADGSEAASYDWTLTGASFAGAVGGIASFSGVDTTAPIDDEAGSATASALTHVAPGVTSTVDGDMLVTLHAYASSSTWTPPAGMSEVVDVASLATPNANGIALEINTESRPTAGATGTRTATATANADRGATQAVALRAMPLICFNDDFNRANGAPGADWVGSNSGGTFGNPVIFSNRLRLTDASASVATLANLQRNFPAAGNRIEVVFDYFAYGGSGADGIAVILSDLTQTPVPGSYGGSLGYAQRTGPDINGFNGGWIGFGLDEYGNFSNPTEGRIGGPGARQDSVSIRGSGSGITGYRYHAGTAANLVPQVDNNNVVPAHRYRVILDHSNSVNAFASVERDTGSGYLSLVPPYDAKAQPGQVAVPASWLLSFSGSTGGSTNIHEIDNLQICATYQTVLSSLDHFDISAGAAASTCTPHSVTLTAQDSSNGTVTGYVGSVTLTTTSGHGDWTLVSGGGVLTNGAANDGIASYQFVAADAGVVTLQLSNHHADDLTIGAVDSGLPASASTSNPISFRDNTFVLTTDTIQVTGRDQAMTAALWRRDSVTGTCAIATGYAGLQNLKGWLSRDLADPAGTAPTIGALSLPNGLPGANNLALTFVAGQANFNLSSSDVGKYSLNLRDDSSGFAKDSAGNPRPIDGSSADITTRPFGLAITNIVGAIANPGVDTPAGAIFTRAGVDFQATVQGVRWQAGDDLNDDGLPDAGANLVDNSSTASYAWGTTLSAAAPFQPATGLLGTLSNGALASAAFSGGSATPTTLQYSEVGSMTLEAQATGYLGTAGADISGRSGVVGRFTPDNFNVTANTPQFDSACGSFSYLGQPFHYTTLPASSPVLTVTAHNAAGGTTQNYSGGWWKLSNASLSGKSYSAATGTLDIGLLPGIDPVIAPGSGSGTLTFSSGGGIAFNRAAPVAPFDAEICLQINISDSDGIAYGSNPASFGTASAGNGIAFSGSKTIRFGRLALKNAYGSELLALSIPLRAEYYDGTNFVTNPADSCTLYDGATTILDNYRFNLQAGETSAGGAGTLLGGAENPVIPLQLSAPGAGNDGSVDVTLPTDVWLRFDWDGNVGTPESNPKARASFGIYKGNPRMIYLREVVR